LRESYKESYFNSDKEKNIFNDLLDQRFKINSNLSSNEETLNLLKDSYKDLITNDFYKKNFLERSNNLPDKKFLNQISNLIKKEEEKISSFKIKSDERVIYIEDLESIEKLLIRLRNQKQIVDFKLDYDGSLANLIRDYNLTTALQEKSFLERINSSFLQSTDLMKEGNDKLLKLKEISQE